MTGRAAPRDEPGDRAGGCGRQKGGRCLGDGEEGAGAGLEMGEIPGRSKTTRAPSRGEGAALRENWRRYPRLRPAVNRISANKLGGRQTRAGLPCHSTCASKSIRKVCACPSANCKVPLQQGKVVSYTRARGRVRPPGTARAAASEGTDPCPPRPWKISLKIGTGRQTLRSTVS